MTACPSVLISFWFCSLTVWWLQIKIYFWQCSVLYAVVICLSFTEFLFVVKMLHFININYSFLCFQLNYLYRIYKVWVSRNCVYARQPFLVWYAILEMLLDLFDIDMTLSSSDCQNQMCLKLSSFWYRIMQITNHPAPWDRALAKLVVPHLVKKVLTSYVSEGSLLILQELTTCPYTAPDEFSPHHPVLFL
jgi:hypothetical protein